jgi:hypothetical protein
MNPNAPNLLAGKEFGRDPTPEEQGKDPAAVALEREGRQGAGRIA